MHRSFALAVAALALLACSPSGKDAPDTDDGAASGKVSVYTNGVIYTGVDDAPAAEAVAVAGGEILAVGTHDIVVSSAGDDVEIVDLGGAYMYPGFTDSHAHLLGIGERELTLNLEGVSSVAELVSIVEINAQHTEDGQILYGRGWIETGWPEERMPNRDDLDPVSGGVPVILTRADGHAMVVNTATLDAAGITNDTPDPSGGKIERDENGRATGILIDNAMSKAFALVEAPTPEQKREAYVKAGDVYTAYGWTGIHNMSVDPADVPIMEALSGDGELNLRVYNALDPQGLAMLAKDGPRASNNGRIITRAIKMYMDGALGSRGAALLAPYSDRPDMTGLVMMEKAQAIAMFNQAIEAGVQVCTHAIGDRGNKLLLDWYEEAFAANQDAGDLRWRDEHTQILDPADIPRFAELGVIASMQPSHAIGDLFFAPDRLGPDRLDGAYAWRSLIDAGAIIAGGSDAPVERGDPRIEFYAAVARRGLDGTQTEDWRPNQAVTREEALKMFTIWPAYASFQENLLGTIEPGKRADFSVFSKDFMTVPAEEILTAETVMTVVDGKIVFDGR